MNYRSAVFNRLPVWALLSYLIIICISCTHETPLEHYDTDFSKARHQAQGYIELELAQLPNNSSDVEASNLYKYPLDADSIELYEYRGDTFYHPVNLSQRCFIFIATYLATDSIKYLDRAKKYATKLMSISIQIDSANYLPYQTRYSVHTDSSITFERGWYSGMAQGQLLEVVTRIFELTGDSTYLNYATSLFNSMLQLRGNNQPWTVRLDDSLYYWIEEYPHEQRPGQTLNGYIAALFGVYDYYRITKDPAALKVWELSLTTLKHYLPAYRQVGDNSLYCLGHNKTASDGYHSFHISLLNDLFKMTGDEFFKITANQFTSDSNLDK